MVILPRPCFGRCSLCFLLFFYTDVFGLTAAAAGTMFLVTRLWDTVNDPLMGMIGDRTKTKWGKFRPYLLFVAAPFAIIGVITFTTPNLESGGKLIYAYITYTLMMMVYTAINVPYASLLGVMTKGHEGANLAGLLSIFGRICRRFIGDHHCKILWLSISVPTQRQLLAIKRPSPSTPYWLPSFLSVLFWEQEREWIQKR